MPDEKLEKEIEQAIDGLVEEKKAEGLTDIEEGKPEEGTNVVKIEETIKEGIEEVAGDVSGKGTTEEVAAKEVTAGASDGDGDAGITEDDTEAEVKSADNSEVGAGEEPPVINDDVLMRAVRAGLSLSDAREFRSVEALERNIAIIERMAAAKDEQAVAEETEEPEDPFANLPTLDPETYQPEVIEMFDKLTGIAKKQHEELLAFRGQQNESMLAANEANTREVTQKFDEQVSGLGEDFKDILGVGDSVSLPQGGSHDLKRGEIANQMSVLLSGYSATEQDAPPFEKVFETAARLVLREEYQQIHERKLAGDLKKRSSQHIQRAGGSKAKSTVPPEDEIAKTLSDKFGIGI